MTQCDSFLNLTGKLLIAMPQIEDDRFMRTIILICAHSDDGAMGIIVNKPTPDLALFDLLEQLKIPRGVDVSNCKVHFGGPVETNRGFLLHKISGEVASDTMDIDGEFGLTGTIDMLRAIGRGYGPHPSMIALGYSGWGPGQIEDEIVDNGWLIGQPDPSIIFSDENDLKWEASLAQIGVSAPGLTGISGRA